jgi:VWFA-related protein
MLPVLLLVALAAPQPLALRVEVQPLGRGRAGTVMGVAFQIAPEDRSRAGARMQVEVVLVRDGRVLDDDHAVVSLSADGSALLYREWPPGKGEVRLRVATLDGSVTGAWVGEVVVTEEHEPFTLPGRGSSDESAPDAVALAVVTPIAGAVRFLPPPRAGGVGAVQLEVEAPQGTSRVEFYQDETLLFTRRRPPWTVSIVLGDIAKRTVVRGTAYAEDGGFIGEDALVLNAPGGRLPVEILLGPQAAPEGQRTITVSVGRSGPVEVTLKADDAFVARWTRCPCVATVREADLKKVRVLSADARADEDLKGNAVLVMGAGGFTDEVSVEQVELPVVVLDTGGLPVSGLPPDAFTVYEDGREVKVDSFGTTDEEPLSLGLVVDTSGSMLDTFPAVRRAVGGFIANLLRPGDRLFLLTFSFDPKVEVPWTSDPRAVADRLALVQPEGGTSLHDALVRGLEEFRAQRGRTALVVLTDGDDTTSRTGWDVALRFSRTMRVPIFPIGFRISILDFFIRDRLKDVAAATGGEAFFAPHSGDLRQVYGKISDQLRAQYLLSYRSPSTKPKGEFRSVRVDVRGEGLTPRTISGYYPGR